MGACGCATSEPQLSQFYRTGMTSREVHALFPDRPEPFVSASRPDGGWQTARSDQYRRGGIYPQIGDEASAFERSHSITIQACDVYLNPRGFFGMGGFYMDYIFYGMNDRLIGFRRDFTSD
jgi:hypothetical protein